MHFKTVTIIFKSGIPIHNAIHFIFNCLKIKTNCWVLTYIENIYVLPFQCGTIECWHNILYQSYH